MRVIYGIYIDFIHIHTKIKTLSQTYSTLFFDISDTFCRPKNSLKIKKSLEKQWISRLVQQVTNNSSNCDMKIKYTLHAYNHCKKKGFELKKKII